jgi:serine protease Do
MAAPVSAPAQGLMRLAWATAAALALALGQVATAEAQAQQSVPVSFAELAERVSPSVVNITTTTTVAGPLGGGPIVPEGSPFEDFFRDFQGPNGPNGGGPRRSNALGSGFVISSDGFIVTNNHVIDSASEIQVTFDEDNKHDAELVGRWRITRLSCVVLAGDERAGQEREQCE